MPLAHGQSAQRVAVVTSLDQAIGGFAAQMLEGRALLDAEQRMALTLPERRL